MMTLLRVLHAETLKMKRTIALKMVVLAPAAVSLLILFAASQAPFSMLSRNGIGNEWIGLERLNLMFWALLMMPLYITLETALIAALDHSENQWRSLLSRPVPRWTFYVAKLIVAMAMILVSTALLLCGVLVDGAILPHLQSQFAYGFPIPWAVICRDGVEVVGLAFLPLAIQLWVSLRCRSFSVAISAGIVGMLIGYVAVVATQRTGGWPQYFPWALPMLVLAELPQDMTAVILTSGLIGFAVVAVGCVDFCSSEVK